jgi:GTP cyclohydrolase I
VTDDADVEADAEETAEDAKFNDEVRNALKEPVAAPPASAASTGSGIADAEGLGFPGKFGGQRASRATWTDARLAKGSLIRLNATPAEKAANVEVLAAAIRTVLECIGEDPDREGLQRTPERYAKALMWMTKGYEERLTEVINDAVFAEDHEEMVIVRDIDVFSCASTTSSRSLARFRSVTSRTSSCLVCQNSHALPRPFASTPGPGAPYETGRAGHHGGD